MVAQKAQRPLLGGNNSMKLGTPSLVRKSQAWRLVCVLPTPLPPPQP